MTEQTETVLERAARLATNVIRNYGLGELDAIQAEFLARAVLMAIRQPTKRMIFEGNSYHGPREFDLGLAYTAMIDAALEG